MTVKMYPERPKEWGPLGIRIMIGSRNGLNFISDKKSTPPKPENSYEAKQRAREEILNKARAQYKNLPSETAEDAPFKTQDPVIGLYPMADLSELQEIYNAKLKNLHPTTAIECFVICEPTYETPFKTVRSRVNGAHVYIWQNNQWEIYPHVIRTMTDSMLRDYPDWTQADYDEEMSRWGTFG